MLTAPPPCRLVLFYGLPAAAVLAIELLRHNQRPMSNDPDHPDHPNNHVHFPARSEVIRNLSVFISCLEWVARRSDGSPDGNCEPCQDALRMLTKILDAVLDSTVLHVVRNDGGAEQVPGDQFAWMGDLLQEGAAGMGAAPFLEGLGTHL